MLYKAGGLCYYDGANLNAVMGIARRLTSLSDKLISIKGIMHGKLVMSRAD